MVCWPFFWYVDCISGILTVFLVYWPYFWYVDHISGMLTIFLVCWPYFWYFYHISGMLTIFLVCWPYYWYFDHTSGMLTKFLALHCSIIPLSKEIYWCVRKWVSLVAVIHSICDEWLSDVQNGWCDKITIGDLFKNCLILIFRTTWLWQCVRRRQKSQREEKVVHAYTLNCYGG